METANWELIAKKLNSELTPEEEKQFDIWIKSEVQNETIFKEAEKLWLNSANIKPEYNPDVDRAWAEFQSKIAGPKIIKLQPEKAMWLKIAAVIFFALALGLVVSQFSGNGGTTPSQPTAEVKEPVKEILRMLTLDSAGVYYLPDSSRITLDMNSRLTFPEKFTDSVRMVTLTGEAFFDVKKNPLQPFIIKAGKSQIRVLGTSFNVRAYENEKSVQVTVVTGKVRFTSANKKGRVSSVDLTPQEHVVFSKETGEVSKVKEDIVKTKKLKWWQRIFKRKKNETK
jgi:transmembrane sensor